MCTSDIYALDVLMALNSWGLRVPDDVGLIGFDDIDILKYVRPALTTISYPVEEIAKQAFTLLKRLMNGESVAGCSVLIDSKIVVRDSI